MIYDQTSGDSYGIYYTYTAERHAAWILETQWGAHSGHWGTVAFGSCKWLDSAGTQYNMTAGTGYYYKKIMTNYYGEVITPSAISGGTSFTITRN